MSISLYFLKKYELDSDIYKSISAQGVTLLDFFIKNNINNKYSNLNSEKLDVINQSIKDYLNQTSKLENVFNSVVMLDALNLLSNDIIEIKQKTITEIKIAIEEEPTSLISDELLISIKKYDKILNLRTIKQEKNNWEAFILFFNNNQVSAEELEVNNIAKQAIEELLKQNIIKKDNYGYCINKEKIIFQESMIRFQQDSVLKKTNKKIVNTSDKQSNVLRILDELNSQHKVLIKKITKNNAYKHEESNNTVEDKTVIKYCLNSEKKPQCSKKKDVLEILDDFNSLVHKQAVKPIEITRDNAVSLKEKIQSFDMKIQENCVNKNNSNNISDANDTLKQIVSFDEYMDIIREDCPVLYMKLKGYSDINICALQSIEQIEIIDIIKENLNQMPIVLELYIYKELYQKIDIPKEVFIKTFNLSREMYNLLSLKYNKGIETMFAKKRYYGNNQIMKFLKNEQNKIQRSSKSFISTIENIRNNYVKQILVNNLKAGVLYNINHIFNVYKDNVTFGLYKITDRKRFIDVLHEIKEIQKIENYYQLRVRKPIKETHSQFNILDIQKILDNGVYDITTIREYSSYFMGLLSIKTNQEFIMKCKNSGIKNNSFYQDKELIIGNYTKNSFISKKINNFINQPIEVFLEYMNYTYGLNNIELKKYLKEEFNENISIDDGIILSNSNNIVQIKQQLPKKLYYKNKVEQILFKNGIEEINSDMFTELGFEVKEDLVYSSEFSSAGEVMEDRILSNRIYDSNTDIFYGNYNLYNAIYKLEREYQIFTLSKGKYYITRFLDNADEVIKEFEDFVSSVEKYVEFEQYFSIHSLIENGFEHNIFKEGFEMATLDRLLKNSNQLTSLNVGNNDVTLYVKSQQNKTIVDFLSKKIKEKGNITIDKLIMDVNDEYGISLVESTVIRKIIELDYFYSKPLNKIYIDKNDYLDEVYGE